MNNDEHNHMADEHSGADLPPDFIRIEVDEGLELTMDQLIFIAGMSRDDDKVYMSQPISSIFVQWYALAAFIAQAPEFGVLLDEALNAQEFLEHVLDQEREGSGAIFTELKRWFRDNPSTDEEGGDDATEPLG